jgi:hypothetical protein
MFFLWEYVFPDTCPAYAGQAYTPIFPFDGDDGEIIADAHC